MISLPPNISLVISLDLNTSKVAYGDLTIDYFQMIRNNNQVKDKYNKIIDKGEKFHMNLKDALKGVTLTDGALSRFGIAVLGKDILEYKKEKQRQQYDKHIIVLRNAEKVIKSVFKLTMT